MPGEGATQTLRLRAERLAARLADALPPAYTPATVPANVPLRDLAGELAVMEREGRPEAFVTVTGLRVDSEIVKDGDEALHDLALSRAGDGAGHTVRI